jgi:hypothetical protein
MKSALPLAALLLALPVCGCGNSMRATVAPEYVNRITPVDKIGIGGPGASNATPAFIELGYQAVDVGISPSEATAAAAARGLRYVAIVDATDTSQATWSGFFSFSMRVSEVGSGVVVWTGGATYGKGGVFISVQGSTTAAYLDMVRDFAKTFPPTGGVKPARSGPAPAE